LFTRDQAEREIDRVDKLGARYLVLGQGLYPRLLAELEDAPPLLMAKGDLKLLERQSVAIVGARNASAAACRFARGLAHDLGGEGLAVVSGLARGIDSAAHDGALETGTIAVIAGGIDVFYPPENEERQRTIAERGIVIAEMPPGTEPRARHFPYRNRIIAGISIGTVVVEAAPKSGSLITARLAAEAGREVMAVPGSPLDPRAQGCNQLIRDGATLVQTAADVAEAIRLPTSSVQSPPARFELSEELNGEEALGDIEGLLGPSPVPVDEIIRLSGASSGAVQMALLELDLAGRLDRHAGGKVSLRPA
jgi:DNA processing protein